MTVDATAETMRAYLDAFLARGDFADYFTDEVTWTTVGGGRDLQGHEPGPRLPHLDAHPGLRCPPKGKTLVVGDGQPALEADFIGTHTGEFLGMAATGKSVRVPYCVVYDLRGDKRGARRAHLP